MTNHEMNMVAEVNAMVEAMEGNEMINENKEAVAMSNNEAMDVEVAADVEAMETADEVVSDEVAVDDTAVPSYVSDEPLIKATIPWTAKQAIKMYDCGTIDVNHIVQRSFKWDRPRMSLLIHSMIYGFPIPTFWARKRIVEVNGKQTKCYDLLDGKQRLMTIASFLHDEFALLDCPPIKVDGKLTYIDGLTFSKLPEELQDAIKDYPLNVSYYENISDSQVRELFKRLNNGKPLTTKEKNIANAADIVSLTTIGDHEFFRTIYKEKALDRRDQIPVIMKMWIMLHDDIDTISFDTADMNQAMEDVVMSDIDKAEIISILDKALAIYNALDEKTQKMARRKLGTEVHFVSMVPFIKKGIEYNIPTELMRDFVAAMYGSKVTVSATYNENCKSGSAHNGAVMARHNELAREWDAFFSDDADEERGEVIETEPTVEPAAEYAYGMRNRGFAPACQPSDGLVRREDPADDKYYDVLIYNRELTDDEVAEYELDKLF